MVDKIRRLLVTLSVFRRPFSGLCSYSSYDGSHASAADGLRRVTVLEAVSRGANNPYTDLLVDSLPPEIEVVFFEWRRALLGHYDVLHVHWPEQLCVGKNKLQSLVHCCGFLLLIFRVFVSRCQMVWTVHNLSPHENVHFVARFVLKIFYANVNFRILLNRSSEAFVSVPPERMTIIPHGSYSPIVEPMRSSDFNPSCDFLFFGLIREYKNVDGLICAFKECQDEFYSLRICGIAQPSELGLTLAALAEGDSRIRMSIGYVDQVDLVRYISSCLVVVLPYRRLLNSGAVLYSLSVGRPVLVPRTPATEELLDEFGSRWIHIYDGQLRGDDLISCRTQLLSSSQSDQPDMTAREWDHIGLAHAAVFRSQAGALRQCRWLSSSAPDQRSDGV